MNDEEEKKGDSLDEGDEWESDSDDDDSDSDMDDLYLNKGKKDKKLNPK